MFLWLLYFQVHNILAEMVMGGMVLETNMNEIVTQIDAQNKLEKSEVRTKSTKIDLSMIILLAWCETVTYLLVSPYIQLLVLLQMNIQYVAC